MENKDKIIAMYREAATEAYKSIARSKDSEYGSPQRELFAEKYGRRQAYGRVLREVYGVQPSELQKILDDLQNLTKQ